MFEREFDGYQFEPESKEREHSVYNYRSHEDKRKQLDETLLATGIKIKEAYHQDRYRNAPVPEPLVVDKEVRQELEVAKLNPTETCHTSSRPKF